MKHIITYVPDTIIDCGIQINYEPIIPMTRYHTQIWFLGLKEPDIEGIEITSMKIQEIAKEYIQTPNLRYLTFPYFYKFIVLTINNKYPLIWVTNKQTTKLILPEELQKYLKQ
jgi:hypothetical protein